ncbi:MAG TPA: T9SS type A sorting domain-containing protein [Bacteroidia bacterium]
MRSFFLWVFVFLFFENTFSQTNNFWEDVDTTQLSGYTYREQVDAVFNTLDTSFYPSGILYDRVPGNSFINSFTGAISDTGIMSWNKWFTVYNEMIFSHRKKPNIPEFITLYDTCFKQYYLTHTVNIGLLNYKYHKLRDGAIDSGWVQLRDEKLYDAPNRKINPYIEKKIFSLVPLIDTLRSPSVTFKLDSQFFFSNDNDPLRFIEADLGDGAGHQEISPGRNILATYSASGKILLEFIAHFESGKKLYSHSYLEVIMGAKSSVKGESVLSSSPGPDVEFEISIPRDNSCPVMLQDMINNGVVNPSNANLAYAKVGIWYNKCNTDKQVRKPILFATGYDPTQNIKLGFGNNISDSYAYINNYPNGSVVEGHFLLDALRAEGCDIIIIDDKNGGDCVENYALLVEALIKKINGDYSVAAITPTSVLPNQYQCVTHHELVVIGYSLGAVTTRYALAEMEEKHFNPTLNPGFSYNPAYPHHRTKTWISFEGEQQGANVQLGLQYYNTFLVQPAVNSLLMLIPGFGISAIVGSYQFNESLLRSNTAREFLVYHRSQNLPNTFFNLSISDPPGPHPMRYDLLRKFANLNSANSPWPNEGYPSFPRLVSVANGSSNATPQGKGSASGEIIPGEELFSIHRTSYLPLIQTRIGIHYRALEDKSKAEVFGLFFQIKFWWNQSWKNLTLCGVSVDHPKEYDSSPGSVVKQTLLHHWTCNTFNNLTFGGYIDDFFNGNCSAETFCPTVSAHDLRDASGRPQPLGFNFQTSKLMYKNISQPNLEYGYPHINYPTNHKTLTPFNAIYAPPDNEEHVMDKTKPIQDFIFGEVAPYDLELQNRTIGNEELYYADFEARKTIIAGKDVEVQFQRDPVGDFIVQDLGRVTFRSGETIKLESGFRAVYGSSFRAYNNPYPCPPNPVTRIGNPKPESGESKADPGIQVINFSKKTGKEIPDKSTNDQVIIYPNPNNGRFTIFTNSDAQKEINKLHIVVLDVMGKIIVEKIAMSVGPIIDISAYPKGMYIVKIILNEEIKTAKIIYN